MSLTQVQSSMLIGSPFTTTATTTTINSNGTAAITVNSSQNVGIGTSSPANPLDVTGTATTNSAARSLMLATDSTSFALGVGGGITFRAKYNTAGNYFDAANIKGIKENATDGNFAGAMVFTTSPNGGSPTERMRIDSSGNVGIGITPPAYDTYNTLTVQNMSLASFSNGDNRIVGNAYYQSSNWKYQNTAPAVFQSVECANGIFVWSRAPSGTAGTNITWSELMRLDTSGNLLVGTTSATAKLTTSASSGTIFAVDASSSNDALMRWTASGVSKAYAYWTPGTDRLYMVTGSTNGLYLANGGTSWTAASDERVKENLIPITDAVEKVNTLRAVTGNYINDTTKKSKAFLIAQDVLSVFPEAVDTTNQDEYGLNYTDIIPLLVAAIKELNAKIEALEAQKP